MKKNVIAALVSLSVCLGVYAGETGDEKKVVITKAEIAKGKALIAKSDCFACHKEADKLVGPPYADVAKKYKPTVANIDLLAGKILTGGSGVWGPIPMAPHPAIPKEDAKSMVKYILSVATEKVEATEKK